MRKVNLDEQQLIETIKKAKDTKELFIVLGYLIQWGISTDEKGEVKSKQKYSEIDILFSEYNERVEIVASYYSTLSEHETQKTYVIGAIEDETGKFSTHS